MDMCRPTRQRALAFCVALNFLCPRFAISGEAAKPAALPPEPAPVQVPYEMPMSGFVAIHIHDKATGRLVRRLVVETPREKGKISESWDLRDNNGQPVPPGGYTFSGIARPPFKLTYELTVYNSGTPAWFAPKPAKGGGSWLADHTMGSDVAAQKETIWISAPVAESGHSLIATDLDGVKLWGTGMGHFGFDGPRKIAADERCAYAATPNMLFRVDPARNFAARNIFTFPNQADLPWAPNHDPATSGSGLAARDGKLYYAVNAPSSWLKPAFVSDDIDPLRCKPFVYLYKGHGRRQGRDDKNYDFYEYDELMLLYSAFCCEKTPAETPGIANYALNSSVRASFGDASKSGPLRGSVVLTFRRPVTIGSIVVPDGAIQVMAMKPGRVMPDTKGDVSADAAANSGKLAKDDLDDGNLLNDFKEGEGLSDDWVILKGSGVAGKPAIVSAPEGGMKTAALRFKVNRLKYSLVLAHRFEDVARQAKRLYTEGKETPGGGWRTTRTDVAINDYRPAAMALAWTARQPLRGITLERTPGGTDPDAIRIAVDAWTGEGAPGSPEALKQDAAWRQIHFSQYHHSPMVHQMDFDGIVETAGLRIRFVNVKKENEKFEAGFDAVVAYHPIGGEAKDLPPDMTQRVSVFKLPAPDDDKQPAAVERHIPIAKPGNLAFDAAGILHCVSAGQVVTVPLKDGEASRVVIGKDKLEAPLALAFGPDGLLHVSDNGPKAIKVFKPDSGELVKTLGTPGGLKPGKWDAAKFNCPSGLAVDRQNRPWVTDWCWAPKRVVRYSADGKPEKEFLGPTQYGGGGTMDTRDRRLIYYAGMKFAIDWDARSWKLDSLMGHAVDRSIYAGERRYMVGPTPQDGRLVSIAEEKDGVAKLMAQAGFLREWDAFKTSPELCEKFGGLDLANTLFLWSDQNGDRAPQAAEVQTLLAPDNSNWTVGEDLALLSRSHRLRPLKTLADGVPVYDLKDIEKYNSSILQGHNDNPWGDDQGRIFMTGAKLIDASGKNLLWNYPNEFNKHDGFYASGFGYNRPPGVLNQEHSPIGHIKSGKEEFFITNSDQGDWFCYSADGILVGCIMGGPAGYGKKAWTMPEWDAGKLDLSDLRPGQEHYQGCVVRTDDGHVYAVAGHNHMSIVRVDGLEQTQRLSGEFKVTDEHIEQTRQWALREAQRQQTAEAPKVARMLYSSGSPEIDGFHGDWPEELFVTVAETTIRGLKETRVVLDCNAALAFDDKNLYLAMKARDESPLKNSAEDPLTLFKNGDAAELTLRTDSTVDAKQSNVAPGDIRLLFAKVKGKPAAVLYKPIDPAAKPESHREFSSPVGRFRMDRVEILATAKMAFDVKKLKDKNHDGTYWIMEASVPWAALGIKPPETGAVLRGDFGYLESDENGTQTAGRHYWSGRTQTVVSDLPSEARLNPSLWGRFDVVKPDAKLRIITQKKNMDANDLLKPDAGKELEELLK